MTYMRRAISLATLALGSTSPNPAVGAVVVKEGDIVGEGFTQPAGGSHAEIIALKQAGRRAEDATMYVTLEPCNHYGKTPPCTEAIITSGIREVVVSIPDPNTSVIGGGMARLSDSGIGTNMGDETGRVERQLEAWLKFVRTGSPFVTAKFAMSMDGKIATRTGDSKWVTGDKARWYAHQLRSISDAVMVGVGTVIADDPKLTARDEHGHPSSIQPLRVIVDSKQRTPPNAKMWSEPGETYIASSTEKNAAANSRTKVDLPALLQYLAAERDVASILVEGGGSLLGSLFDQGLIDKVVAIIAPTIIGGSEAVTAVAGLGAGTMREALSLQNVKRKNLGRDIAIIGYC